MKRIPYKVYGLIALTLLLMLAMPIDQSRRLRGSVMGWLAPLSNSGQKVLSVVTAPKKMWDNWGRVEQLEREVASLQGENARLLEEWRRFDRLVQSVPPIESELVEVVYRDPTSWGSSCWINRGTANGSPLLQKNSPVLLGDALVGVIDFVGKKQSRVRLITDSAVVPSVRALRGTSFLAKGELHGSSEPLWRALQPQLRGVGFNYDFADEEGPARDLRSGAPIGAVDESRAVTLLQEGDLLVTTGMDGIFPAGLTVATVTKVDPLKEGATSYSLEAKPAASSLSDLTHLFVLPPVGFDPEVSPPLIGEELPDLPPLPHG